MTTQQHIDGLISSIRHATEDRSVTNVMVGRVLDWLNRRAEQLQADIDAGHEECRQELEAVRYQIKSISDAVKGVNTLASNAYGRADTNARAIDQISTRLNAMIQELLKTGHLPESWGNGLVQVDSGLSEHIDRGLWKSGERYYAGSLNESTGLIETSHVWYLGCKYRCLTTGTEAAPKWNSSDWMFEEGDPEPHMVFTGVEDSFMASGETKEIGCRVILYNQDVTEDVAEWEITRDTGSNIEDNAWSLKDKARNFDGNIDIVYSSDENDLGYEGKALFRVKARFDTDMDVTGVIEI